MATDGRSGDRMLVGARFSAPVQTGPGAHPASCTMGTGSLQWIKRPGRGADHPNPSKCRSLKLCRAIPLPALRPLLAGADRTVYVVLFLYVACCNLTNQSSDIVSEDLGLLGCDSLFLVSKGKGSSYKRPVRPRGCAEV